MKKKKKKKKRKKKGIVLLVSPLFFINQLLKPPFHKEYKNYYLAMLDIFFPFLLNIFSRLAKHIIICCSFAKQVSYALLKYVFPALLSTLFYLY